MLQSVNIYYKIQVIGGDYMIYVLVGQLMGGFFVSFLFTELLSMALKKIKGYKVSVWITSFILCVFFALISFSRGINWYDWFVFYFIPLTTIAFIKSLINKKKLNKS